jgi:hypothetical protein
LDVIYFNSYDKSKSIKVYIVTYKAKEDLNNNLKTLFASDLITSGQYTYEINIINNHSNFHLAEEFQDKVNVLHNVVRPDFSTGHLSRDWNCAIINGFQDLNNPDCDILVTSQDDVLWQKDWVSKLIEYHKKYTFISFGPGDCVCSYLPEAVKKVGLWDERFCNIGYQEADYFLRQTLYNKDSASINDYMHFRLHNSLSSVKPRENIDRSMEDFTIIYVPGRDNNRDVEHMLSVEYHNVSLKMFQRKYNCLYPEHWEKYNTQKRKIYSHQPILYPYFEKDCDYYSTPKYRKFRWFFSVAK